LGLKTTLNVKSSFDLRYGIAGKDVAVPRAARVQLLGVAPDEGKFWQPVPDELELIGARGRVCRVPP
jgi:hypothetical protein